MSTIIENANARNKKFAPRSDNFEAEKGFLSAINRKLLNINPQQTTKKNNVLLLKQERNALKMSKNMIHLPQSSFVI